MSNLDSIELNIKLFEENNSSEDISRWVSTLFLRFIDIYWVEHLTSMDNMRQGIGLQAAGQRNPLIQYKKNGFDMFEDLLVRIKRDLSLNLFTFSEAGIKKNEPKKVDLTRISNSNLSKKIGRNDPCPCGSEVKYKKCFGTPECKL